MMTPHTCWIKLEALNKQCIRLHLSLLTPTKEGGEYPGGCGALNLFSQSSFPLHLVKNSSGKLGKKLNKIGLQCVDEWLTSYCSYASSGSLVLNSGPLDWKEMYTVQPCGEREDSKHKLDRQTDKYCGFWHSVTVSHTETLSFLSNVRFRMMWEGPLPLWNNGAFKPYSDLAFWPFVTKGRGGILAISLYLQSATKLCTWRYIKNCILWGQ